MKSAEEEWKHDIVYDPEGQNDIYFCTDLLYDFKGHGERYGWFDLIYISKVWLEVPVTYSRTPKATVTLVVGFWPSLWPHKVKGWLVVGKTYFLTHTVTVTLVVALT